MSVLVFGVLLIVAIMLVVMGVPLLQYLARDDRWTNDANHTVQSWYARLQP